MKELYDHIFSALVTEMENRDGTLDFITNERTVMADAANDWTAANGIGHPVTVAQIETIEHRAMGYCDYASKIALYVAQLALRGEIST